MNKVLFLFAMCFVFFSCSNEGNEITTPSGYTFKIVRDQDTPLPINLEHLVVSIRAKDSNDSLWLENIGDFGSMVIQKRENAIALGDSSINEIFNYLSQGDSVTFKVPVDEFFLKTVKSPPPPGADLEQILHFEVRIDTVIPTNQYRNYAEYRRNKAVERNNQLLLESSLKQSAQITEDLKKKNIETFTTEKGVHVLIKKEGFGEKISSGDTIAVDYTGYLYSDSTYFDSSVESKAKEFELFNPRRTYKPLEVIVDKTSVIQGWHNGFKELKEGSEATLIIPSAMGYGSRWAGGGKIPPDSPLIFEVKITKKL